MGRAGAHVNRAGVAGRVKPPYPPAMADAAPSALDRIERALTRIEAAAARRAFDAERLEHRHAALRGKVEEAIAALDALIVQEDAD